MSVAISAYRTPYQPVSRTKMSFSQKPQIREISLEGMRNLADKEGDYGKEAGLELLMKRFRTECNKKNNPEGIFNAAKDALTFIFVEMPDNSNQHDGNLGAQIVERLGKTGSNLKKEVILTTAPAYIRSTRGSNMTQEDKRKTWDKMTEYITYQFCNESQS